MSLASPSPGERMLAEVKLVVAISSRALFDLDESNQVFEAKGEEEYSRYQISQEGVPLLPGVAFSMVRKLLALNTDPSRPRVEVVLVSRNSADTGLRVFNSIRHHGLDISRAAFTRGEPPYRYIASFGAHLFLSANPEDVRGALDAGIAAATILPSGSEEFRSGQLRIAFDGDAVIFSDEAERIYVEGGLDAFNQNETESSEKPLPGGPFKPFLAALHDIQSDFPVKSSPIRTALITARGRQRTSVSSRHSGAGAYASMRHCSLEEKKRGLSSRVLAPTSFSMTRSGIVIPRPNMWRLDMFHTASRTQVEIGGDDESSVRAQQP